MRILGNSSVIRRKRPDYIKITPQHTAENIINRQFEVNKPNQKWFTDITYLKFGNGTKAYLNAVIDAYDRCIVAWKVSSLNNNKLVKDTLDMAFTSNPKAKPIIHSDRGFQYTSGQHLSLREKYKFTISMSRVSKCLDNQPIESF